MGITPFMRTPSKKLTPRVNMIASKILIDPPSAKKADLIKPECIPIKIKELINTAAPNLKPAYNNCWRFCNCPHIPAESTPINKLITI